MSDSSFFFEIVTPEKVLISDSFDSVELPGKQGEFQILSGHTPFMSGLTVGSVTLMKGAQKTCASISGGYCEVMQDKTTVLVHTAELAEDIDVARAEDSEKRARKRLSELKTDTSIDEERAKLSLMRALSRLNTAKMK
ncbi:F0F1 ATP synthase subunit epsilon [Candidatus Latescibacterota bacterium]